MIYLTYKKQEFSEQEHKEALVVTFFGGSGVGKSTMINAFINFWFGIEKYDDFRLLLVDDSQNGIGQVHSQTQEITTYFVKAALGRSSLIIIDNPGFNDTRGVEQDDLFDQMMQKFFGQFPARHLNAVFFVSKGDQNRITAEQEYLFERVKLVFGKDIITKVLFAFSHTS